LTALEKILLGLISSFLVVIISLPSVYRVAKLKNLYDIPDNRKVHKQIVPRLGGIGIFAAVMFIGLLLIDFKNFPHASAILAAIIIMFFTGIKDDILIIAPLTKMLGQTIASLVIIFFAKIQLTDLHGFFSIHHISPIIGIPLTLLTILVIINAFNFIDGIDGLSASLGALSGTTFGVWFYLVKDYNFAIIAAILVGALLGFLPFNFSKKRKMFMGDSGSLILGLIIAVLAIEFNQKNLLIKNSPYFILPAPAVSMGILAVPLYDMLRVIYIRLLTKRKIFKPDRSHIHHVFLALGFSHKQIVLILTSINLFFIVFSFGFSSYITIRRMMLILLLMAMIIFFIPSSIARRRGLID